MVHFFYSALYSKTIDLMCTGSLKEGIVSHPLKKDPSDVVGNRRAAVQTSTPV